jgi:hypothetical protein
MRSAPASSAPVHRQLCVVEVAERQRPLEAAALRARALDSDVLPLAQGYSMWRKALSSTPASVPQTVLSLPGCKRQRPSAGQVPGCELCPLAPAAWATCSCSVQLNGHGTARPREHPPSKQLEAGESGYVELSAAVSESLGMSSPALSYSRTSPRFT